jgi:hypothetical protein
MRYAIWAGALALAALPLAAENATRYPATRQGDVVDDLHGTRVPDPYRWLEDAAAPNHIKNLAHAVATTAEGLESLATGLRATYMLLEQVKTLVELAEVADFYFRDEIAIQEEAQKKGLDEAGKQVLTEILPHRGIA